MPNKKNGYVFFDESTDFNGEIEASRVVLAGKVNGVVRAERELHLKQGALIEGKIYTGNFSADQGTICDGELHIEHQKNMRKINRNGNSDAAGNRKNNFFLKIASLFSFA